MTHEIDTTPPANLEDLPKGNVRFYRNRRIVRPLLVSIVVLFVTAHPFLGFISYVLSGLYWDWSFFTYNGFKDSEQAPKAYFEANGMTPQQIDELNTYLIKVRWGAFAASTSITTFCLLFFPDYAYQAIFVLTYIGITLTSMIVGFSNGRIISLYHFGKNGAQNEHQFSYPVSHIFSSFYNPCSNNLLANPFATSSPQNMDNFVDINSTPSVMADITDPFFDPCAPNLTDNPFAASHNHITEEAFD